MAEQYRTPCHNAQAYLTVNGQWGPGGKKEILFF